MQFLLYTLFFVSALLLILVILVQEGKGGGLGGALGGAGSETFGVRAGGVNKVTFIIFLVFVLSAMSLHWTSEDSNAGTALEFNETAQPIEAPVAPQQ
ncbi:MAG: preprotein translocase subunit SecG [Planctomycetes bacterium]|nr:preprotein translocase subunit SecG [Planctomycetota bacterium]